MYLSFAPMRLLFPILFLFFLQQAWSQDGGDDFVRTTERLRHDGSLTTKTYPGKTFAGSLTGYYHNGTLVLINTLTDAEAAGTETLYFIRDGALSKVFIMAAQFEAHEEWAGYFSKHKLADKCYACHGKRHCVVTVITFDGGPIIAVTEKGMAKHLTEAEQAEIIGRAISARRELEALLKEL